MYTSSKGLEFRHMHAVQILGSYLLSLILRQWEELVMVLGPSEALQQWWSMVRRSLAHDESPGQSSAHLHMGFLELSKAARVIKEKWFNRVD